MFEFLNSLTAPAIPEFDLSEALYFCQRWIINHDIMAGMKAMNEAVGNA
jgi:hypothetical protein